MKLYTFPVYNAKWRWCAVSVAQPWGLKLNLRRNFFTPNWRKSIRLIPFHGHRVLCYSVQLVKWLVRHKLKQWKQIFGYCENSCKVSRKCKLLWLFFVQLSVIFCVMVGVTEWSGRTVMHLIGSPSKIRSVCCSSLGLWIQIQSTFAWNKFIFATYTSCHNSVGQWKLSL